MGVAVSDKRASGGAGCPPGAQLPSGDVSCPNLGLKLEAPLGMLAGETNGDALGMGGEDGEGDDGNGTAGRTRGAEGGCNGMEARAAGRRPQSKQSEPYEQ